MICKLIKNYRINKAKNQIADLKSEISVLTKEHDKIKYALSKITENADMIVNRLVVAIEIYDKNEKNNSTDEIMSALLLIDIDKVGQEVERIKKLLSDKGLWGSGLKVKNDLL